MATKTVIVRFTPTMRRQYLRVQVPGTGLKERVYFDSKVNCDLEMSAGSANTLIGEFPDNLRIYDEAEEKKAMEDQAKKDAESAAGGGDDDKKKKDGDPDKTGQGAPKSNRSTPAPKETG